MIQSGFTTALKLMVTVIAVWLTLRYLVGDAVTGIVAPEVTRQCLVHVQEEHDRLCVYGLTRSELPPFKLIVTVLLP